MPAFAPVLVQLATGVGPVSTVAQVVLVYALLEFAVAVVHEAAGVGPVPVVAQVVAM